MIDRPALSETGQNRPHPNARFCKIGSLSLLRRAGAIIAWFWCDLMHDRKGPTLMNLPISRSRRRIAIAGMAALSALAVSISHEAVAADRTAYVLLESGNNSTSMNGSSD